MYLVKMDQRPLDRRKTCFPVCNLRSIFLGHFIVRNRVFVYNIYFVLYFYTWNFPFSIISQRVSKSRCSMMFIPWKNYAILSSLIMIILLLCRRKK